MSYLPTRIINKIIVHCSDSDLEHHDNAETIKRWHQAFGWRDIGYHFVITKNGCIHNGRPIHQAGAHCFGQNEDSIGICLTGRNEFSQEQFNRLFDFVSWLVLIYNINYSEVYPHCYFNKDKTCPNFNLLEVLNERIRLKRNE